MKHIIHSVDCLAAIFDITDIPNDQFETVGVVFDQRNEIFHVPCGEIVQANHLVTPLQQCFAQVGADKSGTARY